MAAKRKQGSNNQSLEKSYPKKKLQVAKKNNETETEKDEFELPFDVSDICNYKWKIYRVSPLYGFSNNKLKLYGRKLSEELASKAKYTSIVTYESKFTLNEKLRLTDQSHEAVQIEVTTDQFKNVYKGIFISWTDVEDNNQGCVSLPILLVNANNHNAVKVHSALSKMFDCDIRPVSFSFNVLVMFFVKILESPKKKTDISQEYISLEYKISGCEVNDSIKVTLSLEDTIIVTAQIIDTIREEFKEATNMDIIFEIYHRILNHIHSVYKIDLIFAELYKVVCSDAFVRSDGLLKLCSNHIAITALNIIQQYTSLEAMINPYDLCINNKN